MQAELIMQVLAQVPDIGTPKAPPGSEKLLTIAQWVLWIASAVCVIGLVVVGAQMAMSHQRGEMGEHGKRLGAVMAGIVIVGASSGIAGALI